LSNKAIILLRRRIRIGKEIPGGVDKTVILFGRGIGIGKKVTTRIKPIESLNEWIIIDSCRSWMTNKV
jgi:hypothetical protein